ncbi:unnamed protein product [Amoebophrya sp. A120]|nr:unnamed protein product [Amoebophrya sp. A120]|eukprot:GSA120T00021332001.1
MAPGRQTRKLLAACFAQQICAEVYYALASSQKSPFLGDAIAKHKGIVREDEVLGGHGDAFSTDGSPPAGESTRDTDISPKMDLDYKNDWVQVGAASPLGGHKGQAVFESVRGNGAGATPSTSAGSSPASSANHGGSTNKSPTVLQCTTNEGGRKKQKPLDKRRKPSLKDKITPFGYRDVLNTFENAPVEVIGEIPSWLFRDGTFYKQSGGAFALPDDPSGTGPDPSSQMLDGLAHVAAWRFAANPHGHGPEVLFSNNFPDTEAYDLWHESGGVNREFAGTAGGKQVYLFNPNVNFQRCEDNKIAPCLIEAPLPVRMVPMDPQTLVTVEKSRNMNDLLESAQDCTGGGPESGPGCISATSDGKKPPSSSSYTGENLDGEQASSAATSSCRSSGADVGTEDGCSLVLPSEQVLGRRGQADDSVRKEEEKRSAADPSGGKYVHDLVFLASHQLEAPNRQNYHLAYYLTPGKDCALGYRVYKLCHDDKNSSGGAEGQEEVAGESVNSGSNRCCEVLADDKLCQTDFPTLFRNLIPHEKCPCMMHTTIETEKYLIIPETSLRWRPGLTLQSSTLGNLPIIGKRWRVPFFKQFEYKKDIPLAFRVYEKGSDAETKKARVRFVCRVEAAHDGHLFHVANAFDHDESGGGCSRVTFDSDFLNAWQFGGQKVTERGMVRFCLEFPKEKDVGPKEDTIGEQELHPPEEDKKSCADNDVVHRGIAASSCEISDHDIEPPGASSVSKKMLLDESPGFPVANPAFLRQKTRFFYAVTSTAFSSLSRVDAETGETKEWKLKHGAQNQWQVSEPQFVPRRGEVAGKEKSGESLTSFLSRARAAGQYPPGSAELDGVLLVAANDITEERSYLLVLDPSTMEELARITAPIDVNYGLHSQFVGPESPEVLPLKW